MARIRRLGVFTGVGVIGFLVDSGVLWSVMRGLHLGLYRGRVVSFFTAATVTWALNRQFTYRDRPQPVRLSRQWLSYMVASSGGALVNYGAYAAFVSNAPLATRYPVIGVAAGSVAGLFFNFLVYSTLVFRASPPAADDPPEGPHARY